MSPLIDRPAPQQKRSRETYEKLLHATGELLEKVGPEGLTANAIIERAGVTPPAFYRYFKDKHEIIAVLGERLMEEQNAIIASMFGELSFPLTRAELSQIIIRHIELTKTFPGGAKLTAVLRASPSLDRIRSDSHDAIASVVAQEFARVAGGDPDDYLQRVRLAIEVGYAAIEFCLSTPQDAQEGYVERMAIALDAILFAP